MPLIRTLFRRRKRRAVYVRRHRPIPERSASLRILNFNTLYSIHEGGNLLREVAVWFGVKNRIHKRSDLSWIVRHARQAPEVVDMIRRSDADVVLLNEILYDIPSPAYLEEALRSLGYQSVYRGVASHSLTRPGVATLPSGMILAYRGEATLTGDSLGHDSIWKAATGGYALAIPELQTTIVGVHLSLLSRRLQRLQRRELVRIIRSEQEREQHIIIVGDFNQDAWKMRRDLGPLGLSVVTARSCPAIPWLPPLRCLDQCWIDGHYAQKNQYMIRSHSDHYAQIVDLGEVG